MKAKATCGIIIITLVIGTIFGILLQKFYPVGNVLAVTGIRAIFAPIPSPTIAPTPTPATPTPELASVIPSEFQGRLSLFVLAGQSNMSGRGDFPRDQTIDPRVFVMAMTIIGNLQRSPLTT